MALSVDMITPHLADIKSGKTTQKALAKAFGVSQPALSKYMARHGLIHDDSPARRGRHPATTDEMLAAVAECEDPKVKIADVARKHNLPYLALARRVQKRRDKLAAEAAKEAKEERARLLAQIPAKQFPTADITPESLAQALQENPDKVIALAKALKALGL